MFQNCWLFNKYSHLYNYFVIFQVLPIQFIWCIMSPQHQHTIRLIDTNLIDTGTPVVIHASKFNTQNQKPCSQGKYCCCLSLLQIKVCFISWCRYPSLQIHLYKFYLPAFKHLFFFSTLHTSLTPDLQQYILAPETFILKASSGDLWPICYSWVDRVTYCSHSGLCS